MSITQADRDKLPARDFAGPHQSFPIERDRPETVRAAWDLAGHAADPAAVRRKIVAIARRMGLESHLPDDAKDMDMGDAVNPAAGRGGKSLGMEFEDFLVAHGGAIKALGDGKIGGHLVLFGNAKATDASAQRDFFTPETNFGLATKSEAYYRHTLDPTLGDRPLGVVELKADEAGIWAEGQLKLRDEYERKIYEMAKAGKLGWSSGTASHLVRREPQSNGSNKILKWPLGLDASLTPDPAEPRTRVVALKSLMLAEAKALHLGEHAGAHAASASLYRLHDMAHCKAMGHMMDKGRSKADRLDAIKSVYGEHAEMAARACKALMDDYDDPGTSDPAAMAGEMKAVLDHALAGLHDGLRLGDHLDAVLAATSGLKGRLASYAALKAADGRPVPAARRDQIKALADELAACLKAAEPRPAEADVLAMRRDLLLLACDL